MTEAITNALNSCRAAWAAFFAENGISPDAITFSDGTPIYAWCLHHQIRVEKLSERIENRISYILSDKPEGEQECRFLNLRPVSRESSSLVASAQAEYKKATAPAFTAHEEATAPAWAEYRKAIAAARAEEATAPAWAEYRKATALAWAEYKKAIAAARAEEDKAGDAAWAEYDKAGDAAWADYEKAVAPTKDEYKRAMAFAYAEYLDSLAPLHLTDVPHHTWNGTSIFSA